MSFLKALNISGSALTAQRMRLDVISENIANIDTTRTENGSPYRRKVVQFQAMDGRNFGTALGYAINRNSRDVQVDGSNFRTAVGDKINRGFRNDFWGRRPEEGGVIVSDINEDETPFRTIYDPTHPDADEYGYVLLPNVDLLKEVVDAMSASRTYEANVTALNSIKTMASKALEVGR